MPLRSHLFPIASRSQRFHFHTSPARRESTPNHYETLQIPPNASQSDVKKSFYNLSKTHHPDRNPNDPTAAPRFIQLSTAYTVLSDPPKRHAYDRTLHPHPAPAPRHSYASSGPVGGRPASGLSRRRAQFRGPPPSFYRSGGWGAHAAKREAAAANEGTGTGTGRGGGMGYRRGGGVDDEVPHFDREAHFRTQESQEERRRRRRREEGGRFVGDEPDRGYVASFLFVGGIIGLAVLVPSLLFERVMRDAGRRRGDGE